MQVKIFCCYARKDKALLDELKAHLRPFQREGLIEIWYDGDINAGTEWETEIKERLNAAQIVLLLLSSDFMNSDYCYSKEMSQALERHSRGEAEVIPVILRHVDWHGEPLGKLQALPTDGKPVMSKKDWDSPDSAFYNIATGIRKVVEKLRLPERYAVSQQPSGGISAQQQEHGSQTQIVWPGNIAQPSTPPPADNQPVPAWQQQQAGGWSTPTRQHSQQAGWGAPVPYQQPQGSWEAAPQQAGGWGTLAQQPGGWGGMPDQQPSVPASQTSLFYLRIEGGKEPGSIYEIRKESLSIGRTGDNDIMLDDLAVSGFHASITSIGDGNYLLRDGGSVHGTIVNGQWITKYQPYLLQDGDKIQLGQTIIIFDRRQDSVLF